MRRGIFLLVALLLVSQAAAVTTLYSDVVYPGDEFVADGVNYSIGLASTPHALYLVVDGEDYVVSYGSCRRSRTGFEEYCYDQSDYVDCEKGNYECPEVEEHGNETNWCCPYDVQHVKFAGGEALWGAHVTFTQLGKPEIALTRTVAQDTSQLDIGEDVRIMLVVENTGEEALTGGRFTEQLPPGFSYQPAASDPHFSWKDGVLQLTVNLDPGATSNYSYTLKPIRYATGMLNGTFSYTVRGEEHTLFPDELTLTAPAPYTLAQKLSKERIFDDQTSSYHLSINNTLPLNLTVQLFGFTLLTTLNWQERGNHLEHSYELAPGEGLNLTLPLEPPRPGWYKLQTVITPVTAARSYLETWNGQLITTRRTLTPDLDLPEQLRSGEHYTLRAVAANLGSDTDFRILSVTVTSPDYEALHGTPGAVPAGTIKDLLETTLTAPNVTRARNLSFTLSGEYKEAGQPQQSFRVTRTLLVLPTNATLPSNASVSNATVTVNETAVNESTQNASLPNATAADDTAPPEARRSTDTRGFIVRTLNALAAWLKSFF